MNPLQSEIERIGAEIFDRMADARPRLFSRRTVAGRILDWSIKHEELKTRLFRLVDVLPALETSREVAEHTVEYLRDGAALPAMQRILALAGLAPPVTASAARLGVGRMAATFILAANPRDAVARLERLRKRRLAFTVDLLGETAVSESEAACYSARYMELIDALPGAAAKWPEVPQIDQADRGPLPRVNISVKISALHPRINPADPKGAIEALSLRLRPLLRLARSRGVFLNFDMESRELKDLTLALFRSLLEEEEFRDYTAVGLALQAYLLETERDLEQLIDWARRAGRRVTIRLVKGAYWDTETIIATQRGWPVPVFERKSETDANYERLARRMLESADVIDSAFGTHNVRTVAASIAEADRLGIAMNGYEIQMLHGMAEPIKAALVGMDCRVREYCPLGEVLPGMAYLVRRLLENTSNESFLRATFEERRAPEELLRDPADDPAPKPKRAQPDVLLFPNEPHADFSRSETREAMTAALGRTRGTLGRDEPLWIGDRAIWTDAVLESRNPAHPEELVGRVAAAGTGEVEQAMEAARQAFPMWSRMLVSDRAGILERAADLMQNERFDLAALEVFEVGKTWAEADADVCEAIDFCRYYAREMQRIDSRIVAIPGEINTQRHAARGVAAIIAPWNFPLAILCGMTVAALVTGNCALMKPSEQSAIIAARFARLLRMAGLPPGTLAFLPGSGAVVGARLVSHPDVALIAFTGSRKVGVAIRETASRVSQSQRHLKQVISELGGKNAVIVDEDADLDEAVSGILASAFGFQGQKCSALSRLIVLPLNRDRLIRRLTEAAASLRIGDPAEPGTDIGPLIDASAQNRVREFIELGRREAKVACESPAPAGPGWYVGPTIFTGVNPRSRLAQEEIFGPVLAVIDAADFDEALRIANDTDYALTGGLYSRSPGRIDRASRGLEVGNLYINRGITGATVARQPFGGFKLSGGGTQAGGPDYLQHFLNPRVVTENTVRRGFAPADGEQ